MSRGTAVKVNRALTRPRLVFGMERKPLGLLFFINFILFVGLKGTYFMVLPVVFMLLGIIVLIRLNKKDSQVVNIYIRMSRFKQSYYPAKSACLAAMEPVRPSIPTYQD